MATQIAEGDKRGENRHATLVRQLQGLLQALRSALTAGEAGLAPGTLPSGWSEALTCGELRTHLLRVSDQAIRDGVLHLKRQQLWVGWWSLDGPRRTREQVRLALAPDISQRTVSRRVSEIDVMLAPRVGKPTRTDAPPSLEKKELILTDLLGAETLRSEDPALAKAIYAGATAVLLERRLPTRHGIADRRDLQRRRARATALAVGFLATGQRPKAPVMSTQSVDEDRLRDLVPLLAATSHDDHKSASSLLAAGKLAGAFSLSAPPALALVFVGRQRMMWRGVEDPRALALARHELRLQAQLNRVVDLGVLHDALIVCTELGYTAAAAAYHRAWRQQLSAQRSQMPSWEQRLEDTQLTMREVKLGYTPGFASLHRPYDEVRETARAVTQLARSHLEEPVAPMAVVAAFRLLDIYTIRQQGERIRMLPDLERGLLADAQELCASTSIVTQGFQATLAISSTEFALASRDPEQFAHYGSGTVRLLGGIQSPSTTGKRLRSALSVATQRARRDLAWATAAAAVKTEALPRSQEPH
jgi:hypothetical protein